MTRSGESTLRFLLKPIEHHLIDDKVMEIVINRPREIGIETQDGWIWFDLPEFTLDHLEAIATLCAAMSQQDVGPNRPLCASILPDGQRVQICRSPAVAVNSISLTIRRPSTFVPTISNLANNGLFAKTEQAGIRENAIDHALTKLHAARQWEDFFPAAVRAKKTMIITGDTGSGKTTLAKALIQEIPIDERLITIEDTAEFIGLPHRNLVSLFYSKGNQGLALVHSEDLIEAALRMRPDRVLMQELRDGAAFTFIRCIAAGHPGSITTCHAGSAAGAFDALRLMIKQHNAGKYLADEDVQGLLKQLVDVIVHCQRSEGQFSIEEVYFDPSAKAQIMTRAHSIHNKVEIGHV